MSFMNENTVDRAVRVIAGIALLALGWGGAVDGTVGTVFKFLGFVPLATGLVGWCPLYAIGRFSTRRRDQNEVVAVG